MLKVCWRYVGSMEPNSRDSRTREGFRGGRAFYHGILHPLSILLISYRLTSDVLSILELILHLHRILFELGRTSWCP